VGTTLEKMATLEPLTPGGRITAAVSSQIGDAAAALLIASEGALRRYKLKPRAPFTTSRFAVRIPSGC